MVGLFSSNVLGLQLGSKRATFTASDTECLLLYFSDKKQGESGGKTVNCQKQIKKIRFLSDSFVF